MHLVAHTTGRMTGTNFIFAVEGKRYEIIDEGEWHYDILDEGGIEHSLSKVAGEDGISYKTWFNLVEQSEE